MTEIEEYLFKLYNYKTHKRLYNKLYYQKYKERLLANSNKRYCDRLLNGDIKINKGEYIINFDSVKNSVKKV